MKAGTPAPGTPAGMLADIRVLEIASIGPGPFCGMMLADHGADVLRIERAGEHTSGLPIGEHDFLLRGRPALELDLKSAAGRDTCLDLVAKADILIEGFRPGVMERLGLGPGPCHQRNPRLVYGRITGWGQEGPLADAAGHDINYIALTGALHAIGSPGGPPAVPLNLLGDYAGGAMLLAFGVLAALHEARMTGRGRVVDAAMVDGANMHMSLMRALHNAGRWKLERGANVLDGAAPYYTVYETADGRHLAVGAIEHRFWQIFVAHIGLDSEMASRRDDPDAWPDLRRAIATRMCGRTLEDWMRLFDQTDACVSPVLDLDEAARHPHATARETFVVRPQGGVEPTPAPRLPVAEREAWQRRVHSRQAMQERLSAWLRIPMD